MKKGIVLITVIGVLLVISFLALVTISMMLQQARIAEHKIKRVKAVFAAKAGIVHTLEQLRKGAIILPVIGSPQNITLPKINKPKINDYTVSIDIIAKGDVANGCPNNIPSDYCVKATAQ